MVSPTIRCGEPIRLPDNTARKIIELGEQICARKVKLKSQGWTGHQIQDDNSIRRFVDELSAIKSAMPEGSTDEGTAMFNSADPNDHLDLNEDWLCYNEPDAHTLQLQIALGIERPHSLSDVESAAHERIAKSAAGDRAPV